MEDLVSMTHVSLRRGREELREGEGDSVRGDGGRQ